MTDKAISDLWWKNAVVYCLDVETFMDGDGDGCGDFRGLTRRIDHLAGLGATCVWLMPFYPSPNRDDGYDITDFYGVDPRLGTLGDFVEFVRTANERGMRVIVDLVVNHVSHEHPWFRDARASRESRYRDWFVWADDPPDAPQKVIFPNVEDSNWAWDEAAGQYYLHRFYTEQPDLNVGNPAVRDELHRIMGFWLQLGVSGFRVDAVPYLIEDVGIEDQVEEDPHEYLRDMRAFMSRRRGDAAMVGEVNLEPHRQRAFFGDDGDELQMLFDFYGCGKLFLALARGSARPLVDALDAVPPPPEGCQWANFVRNHDELNLSRLPDDERDEVLDAFAPDEGMRLFGRGARRRLPPMLGRDPRRVRLTYSLLFTLPGTPTLLYGEEIGMGEDLSQDGRMSIRAPMQWTAGRNGGFSTAGPDDLVRPVITDGEDSAERVNVTDQRRDPGSLLNWMERAIRARKETPELGWGTPHVLEPIATGSDGERVAGGDAVLVHRCDWLGETVLAVHNLAAEPLRVRLRPEDLTDAPADEESGAGGRADGRVEAVADVFDDREGGRPYDRVDPADPVVEVDGHGYRWLRVLRSGSRFSAL